MKIFMSLLAVLLALVLPLQAAAAAVRYVDVQSPNPTPPFTTWMTAARVIQDAVDAAQPGDEIVVTDGVYETGGRAVHPGMTNRVAVTKPLTLRSVNGPDVTVIRGYQVPGTMNGDGAVRCVYLTNGAVLVGFTLTNGATAINEVGGGVSCWPGATVSNCVITGNSAYFGGGAFRGILEKCSLVGNSAHQNGGGAHSSTLYNCVLIGNLAGDSGGGAAGNVLNNSLIASNCIITGNSAQNSGGGVSYGVLYYCSLIGNSAGQSGGGSDVSLLNNCVITGNRAGFGGGTAGASSLNNCTVAGNIAYSWAGGISGGYFSFEHGDYPSVVNNCVVYDNHAPEFPNCVGYIRINYSCTSPLPAGEESFLSPHGIGNLTNAPLFVDAVAGNFRLQPDSPCINAGQNTNAPAGTDLDGNPRVVGSTVDIGAYEFQSPQSSLSYAWLQRYGLPVDGSADLADSDRDGQNNWEEWRAWTDPLNASSALRLLTPVASANGLLVRWQSVSGQSYLLERSTNVGGPAAFTSLASNIVAQADIATFTDTNAFNNGPLFYRVGVQE